MDTTTNNQKIIIQTNDERIELEGQDLEVFNAQRVKDQLELDEQQAKINEIKIAKDSAIEKLSTLGLTEDEITALIS
jgi:hypothetical protein